MKDKSLEHAISIGRTPTYFQGIVEAIKFAKEQAAETGKVQGVHRTGRPKNKFLVREGFHQGSAQFACCYVAHPLGIKGC